jgi:hypothetical protein
MPKLYRAILLAVQVNPDITPKQFWDTALKTGKTNPIQHNGKEYQFGVILDPQALIEEIRRN